MRPKRFTWKESLAAVALRYALAPACVLFAAALHLSPASATLHPTGLFTIAVVAAAWFGGAGPGLLAAVLAAFMLPQLIAMSYPLLGGVLDLPRLVTFSVVGLAVGWGSSRRAGKLREQERFARAMEASDNGFWDWFPASDTVYASPRLLEIYGFTPGTTFSGYDDLVGSIPFDPEGRLQMALAMAEHFAGKTARLDMQMRFTRDGETRWVHIVGVAARDSSGALVRWTGTVRDITQKKRAEDALRESEQRYELAMAASESGYWDWHIPTDRYFVSPRAYELGGYSPGTTWVSRDEFTGRTNMHPEDAAKWEAAREELFAGTGDRLAMEVRYIVRGETRWHMLQAICKRDDVGRVIRWSGSATDITERKRTEDELRLSEARKTAILESALDCIVTVDHEGRITEFNPAAERTFGYRRGDVLGKHLADVIIPPSLRAGHERGLARYLLTGETRVIGRRVEMAAVRADGSEFPAELAITRIPLDGPASFTGYLRDITERKRAEDELRRSEAFLAEGQHLSRTGSFSWSVATGEIAWSEQLYRIFKFDPGVPVTLELIASRVHPEDVSLFTDMIDSARGGGSFDYEHRLLMPDLSVKYLHVIAHATRDKDGRPEYIGAVQDVTERRLSEEALGKARSDLARVARVTSFGALTASIAHEVSQPLSGILTNAGTCLRLLAAEPPNIEGAVETARRTIRDGQRASDVIKRLRALFGNKDYAAEPVDLNDAAREVIAMASSDLRGSRVILRTELADDLPPVTGDRVQLQQVILNLIRNASDAMRGVEDRPRRLIVRTQPDVDDCVRLTVQDAGVGFGPEVTERLFDAFYTTKSDGMGIGLSVSRLIIERHQGRLWAAPNGDGPGATFCFSIPRGEKCVMAGSASEEACNGGANKLSSMA